MGSNQRNHAFGATANLMICAAIVFVAYLPPVFGRNVEPRWMPPNWRCWSQSDRSPSKITRPKSIWNSRVTRYRWFAWGIGG